jgi:hypothetical protein
MESIEENLGREYAEAWRPNPGDMLVGEVVGLSSRDGGFGEYPIVVVRQGPTVETELAFHAIHAVAQHELAAQKPQIGERVAIKYLGRREAASGKPYHSYKIAIDRPASEFDWSRYGGEPDAGVEPQVDKDAGDAPEDEVPF